MRALAIVFALLPVACGDSSAGGSPTTDGATTDGATTTDGSAIIADGGGDAYDAPSYNSEDFASFRYFWGGTGQAGSFNMDRDCGIEAGGYLSYGSPKIPDGAGVVAADECNTFKSLAVSREVVGKLTTMKPGTQCEPITDDYITVTLSLADSSKVQVSSVSGCSGAEPFVTLRTEAARLAGKYLSPTDGGTDSSTD